MTYHGKVWGDTETIFRKNNVEMAVINIKKGGYCSRHKHLNKFNDFYVLEGELKIYVWQDDYNLVDVTIVTAGQKTSIPPGLDHRFEALTDVKCLEIYYVELNPKDIVRVDHGGVNEDEPPKSKQEKDFLIEVKGIGTPHQKNSAVFARAPLDQAIFSGGANSDPMIVSPAGPEDLTYE